MPNIFHYTLIADAVTTTGYAAPDPNFLTGALDRAYRSVPAYAMLDMCMCALVVRFLEIRYNGHFETI